jgi:hypothetical protein
LPKSDPPFGTAGVVRVGMGAAVVALGLPKFPKNSGALTVDVVGAVVVGLGRVEVGNAPKNEGTLEGSVKEKKRY